jgi:hypothetical protein
MVWQGKSCIPASPVTVGIFNSEEEAIGAILKNQPELKMFRKIQDAKSFSEGTDSIMDSPLDFSEPRKFGIRRVAVEEL